MADLVESAIALQDNADAVIAAAETTAAAEIEAAQERQANAERRAQEITDAALQTELGRQISTLREEFSSWKTPLENQMVGLQTTLGEIQSHLIAPPQPPAVQYSSIPPHSDTIIPGDQILQNDAGDQGEAPTEESHKPKKSRKII